MSAFTEFWLIAVALFLWDSMLWLPLRSTALRWRRFGNRWQVLAADRLLVMRGLGLVPMLPLPPDSGLAPCQTPPLVVDDRGGLYLTGGADHFPPLPSVTWDDLGAEPHHLRVGAHKTRISSPRCIEVLLRAKHRGATPAEAVRHAWRLAMSPARAAREWERWQLASAPMRWLGPMLTVGFFAGLPATYIYRGSQAALWLVLCLWCLMAGTAARLWWLGNRVYPGARADLRMDAVLALLVPFHAMRAIEISAVHAMGISHPVSLILSKHDTSNQYLAGFVRQVLHPRPGVAADREISSLLRPLVAAALARSGMTLQDFDKVPGAAHAPAAGAYCPRCHGWFQPHVTSCPDCHGLHLRHPH